MQRQMQLLKNLQRFRLVTFDITDTLLKFKTAPAIQYAKTAASLGVNNIDQQMLSQCFRKEFKAMASLYPNFGCSTENMSWQLWWIMLVSNIFRCVDETISPAKLEEIAHTLLYEYRTRKCWVEIDGATELVKKVKGAGKLVGVISNFDPSLRQILREMNMNNFDFVLTSYDCEVQKPNSAIFEIPLLQCKVKAKEALHIGNIYDIDYLGARRSGWSSLLVANHQRKEDEQHSAHIFKSLKELLCALETKQIRW